MTFGDWFSPSTISPKGFKLRLNGRYLYLLSHLDSPYEPCLICSENWLCCLKPPLAGVAHPCLSQSVLRTPQSPRCPSGSSRHPVSPAAASGAAAPAEAGLFGGQLFCHNLQVSARQRVVAGVYGVSCIPAKNLYPACQQGNVCRLSSFSSGLGVDWPVTRGFV